MKFFSLIWAGLWHRPVRTLFTLVSVVIAFVLFGSLQGLNAGFDKAVADQHLDMLITDSRVPGGPPMPVSALSQIEKIPGVLAATERATFFGWFQQPKNTIAVIAADPAKFFALRPGLAVMKNGLNAMHATRAGMLATPAMKSQFGWKIGDRIPFKSSIPRRDGGTDWAFDLVGTFDVAESPGKVYLAVVNFNYFDDVRSTDRGTAERFLIRIADPHRSAETAAAIDRIFANSSHETRTRSEKEMAQSRLKQMGDVKFLTDAIVGSVLFTLLFVTGNTMRQSVRERMPEFAVLKTVGFSNGRVLLIVMAEALVLCVLAAVIGLGVAGAAAPLAKELIGNVDLSSAVFVNGMCVAIALALVSALVPALGVWRLSVIDALGGH
jgi:putative ABC transport system permease protein